MPQNTFSGTGIIDGQIVEANQVSQSVDAFTNAKDYRISLTGSLTLSGSLNMSGSLVNEYTGQFKTLGLGITAPVEPTMLHIKTTDATGDPIILIEGTGGSDNAGIKLKNTDVSYQLGAFGSSADDFRIVSDDNTTVRNPFVISKNTTDFTLYTSVGSVGIGLGGTTVADLLPLDAGSLQVAGRVSGSSMRAGIISASAAGENIHGTASYASYIETAITASYIAAPNIDFAGINMSISDNINSAGIISSIESIPSSI